MFRQLRKTIKGRILLSTLAFTLLITLLISSICFNIFQNFLLQTQIQSTEFNLQLISESISNQLQNVTYLANWTASNSMVQDCLSETNIADDKEKMLDTYERLREEFSNTHAMEYMERMIVSNNNLSFLQLTNSTTSGLPNSAEIVSQAPFYKQLTTAGYKEWLGMTSDPFYTNGTRYKIIVYKAIYDLDNDEPLGWTYISVSPSVITDSFTNYQPLDDSNLVIEMNSRTYKITQQGLIPVNTYYKTSKILSDMTTTNEAIAYYAETTDGTGHTIVSCKVPSQGWTLYQTLSTSQLSAQQNVYYVIIISICVLVIILECILAFFITKMVNVPITRIREKINKISEGDFSRDEEIEWEHELGDIGKGINILSKDIVNLMNKRIEDEKQKKDLEYQVLQNQVNPHFLYNTLNSICWMAKIQNAPGIAEMTTALSRLLKSISKGSSQIISLREELQLAEHYITIQKYRYAGALTMNTFVESEDLYDCVIPKFTLQPIIENAIFHGIEPKGGIGKILVRVSYESDEKNTVMIAITDNGVGMSQDLIDHTVSGTGSSPSDFFRQIGVNNVSKRIQHTFGEEYTLQIRSKVNHYTQMIIRIPYQKEVSEHV